MSQIDRDRARDLSVTGFDGDDRGAIQAVDTQGAGALVLGALIMLYVPLAIWSVQYPKAAVELLVPFALK